MYDLHGSRECSMLATVPLTGCRFDLVRARVLGVEKRFARSKTVTAVRIG